VNHATAGQATPFFNSLLGNGTIHQARKGGDDVLNASERVWGEFELLEVRVRVC
jgi:hypothetical protein